MGIEAGSGLNDFSGSVLAEYFGNCQVFYRMGAESSSTIIILNVHVSAPTRW